MIKRFCDACEKEIPETANRVIFTETFVKNSDKKQVKVGVEVMVSINGTTNGGEICIACVRHTVAKGSPSNRVTR